MNTQQIIDIINLLPVRYTERTEEKAVRKIQKTAEKISPVMTTKGLLLAKGSGSPSTTRSYVRIYLEYPGADHNPRNKAHGNVVATWEWQTRSKYGYSPLTAKAICEFCDSLVRQVEHAQAFEPQQMEA